MEGRKLEDRKETEQEMDSQGDTQLPEALDLGTRACKPVLPSGEDRILQEVVGMAVRIPAEGIDHKLELQTVRKLELVVHSACWGMPASTVSFLQIYWL